MDSRQHLQPVPPVGRDREFDKYVEQTFGEAVSTTADIRELRRAAWATWKTSAPSTRQPSEEDEHLARALALSVQDVGTSAQPIVIDDNEDDDEIMLVKAISAAEAEESRQTNQSADRGKTPDEEQEMLEQALAASLAESKHSSSERRGMTPSQEGSRKRAKTEQEHDSSSGFMDTHASGAEASTSRAQMNSLGIDRAQLERERLARQAARLGQGQTVEDKARSVPKASGSISAAGSSADLRTSHPLQSKGPFPRDAGGEYYPAGELRHVRLRIGKPSSEPTFNVHDVFGDPSQLSLAIVSSFVWDFDWLGTFLPDPALVPTIRVVRPQTRSYTEARSLQGKLQPMPDGAIHVYPDMAGKGGSEHMKYAWLFYKTGRLRVAIMTANLVPYDYQEIENTIFVQDFLPNGRKLGSAVAETSQSMPDFPAQFARLFAHLKIHKALRRLSTDHPLGQSIPLAPDEAFSDFNRYDWSRVKVRLVLSIPGVYNGLGQMAKSGIGRLAQVVAHEGWKPQTGEHVVAEYQGSSLGGYYIDWFTQFYRAISGMDLATLSRQPKSQSWPPIKVIFPSLATVDASILGRTGGGTMFCGKSFDRHPHLFYDANSKRGGVLMHTKMLIVTYEKQSSIFGEKQSAKRKLDSVEETNNGSDVGGWIYVGSHNFTPSAWGTMNFKNTPPTLNISNYELGIVFPLPRVNTSTIADLVAPHSRPPRAYGAHDEPWSQDKYMPRSV